jgi:hypothetical protein
MNRRLRRSPVFSLHALLAAATRGLLAITVATEERQQCLYAHSDGAGEGGEESKKKQNFDNMHGIAR